MNDRIPRPLDEAAHLHRLATHYEEQLADDANIKILEFMMSDAGRMVMAKTEAIALERGYRLGRVLAAAEVRVGMDQTFGSGSMHWDSDMETPPEWLLRKAETLARGDG